MPLSDLQPKNTSAVVRNHLDEIETALTQGVTRAQIYELLRAEHGVTATYDGFLSALKRARVAASDTPSKPRATDDTDAATTGKPKAQGRAPLKKGDFAAPKNFDPSKFDERYK